MRGEFRSNPGMVSTAWDRAHRPSHLNKDRTRWYGLRVGDIVTLRGPGGYVRTDLRVVFLHPTDNNGCTVKPRRGPEFKAVCEWCEVTMKVKDRG